MCSEKEWINMDSLINAIEIALRIKTATDKEKIQYISDIIELAKLKGAKK